MAENCKDCANCAKAKKTPEPIPYLAHESAMARMERIIRRLWIAVLVLIAALLITNGAWVYYESQFATVETTTTTQEVEQNTEGGGDNHFVGGDYNGTSESADNYNENQNKNP